MLTLAVFNLHWIEPGDQPTDMCAHGHVHLVVDGHVLTNDSNGDWCVSAASIHLLRTLTQSHTANQPVAEHLIPCCGHFIVPPEEPEGDVQILGCNNGVDWQIIRADDHLQFILPDGQAVRVDSSQWQAAVFKFADDVKHFYAVSAAKTPLDGFDAKGFKAMMAEWERRRSHLQKMP
jgi:hypothetical protein